MADRDICLPLSQIPNFTVGAFGHIHASQAFAEDDRPEIFHVGSTDRSDFGEEGQAKYYTIIQTDGEHCHWQHVEIPCRRYETFVKQYRDDAEAWVTRGPAGSAQDAICRVKIRRPEHVKPDVAAIEQAVRSADCFDFYGIEQEVVRDAAVRSEAVTKARTTAELLEAWHEAKGCKVALPELVTAAEELEVAA